MKNQAIEKLGHTRLICKGTAESVKEGMGAQKTHLNGQFYMGSSSKATGQGGMDSGRVGLNREEKDIVVKYRGSTR